LRRTVVGKAVIAAAAEYRVSVLFKDAVLDTSFDAIQCIHDILTILTLLHVREIGVVSQFGCTAVH
jgi:hypothetical protein